MLGNLFVSIRASASEWASDVKAIQREGREMEKALKPLQDVAKGIGMAFAAAGAAITGALVVAIKTTADYNDEVNDLSLKSGIATETLSKWTLAAETSGSSMSGLASGLKLLGKNMELATSGSKEQIKAFAAAGISASELAAAHGDVNKILPRLADSFANAEDGAGKTAISMALLGRSGSDLIPMLNEGSAGLKRWGDEAQKAGRVVTAEAAAAADEFNDQLRILEVSVLGLSAAIANSLIPRLTEWVKEGTKVVQQVKDWAAANKTLTDGLSAMGPVLLGTGGILAAIVALPKLITAVRTAVVALGATISVATAGLSAALAAVIVFRKEIAMGLMAALATVVKQFEDFTEKMANVAGTIGAGGLSTKLHEASFSMGTFRRELEAANTQLMLENMELGKTAGQLAAEEAARTKAAAATTKHRLELEKNIEVLAKEKQALQESLKKRMDFDYDYAMGLQMAFTERKKRDLLEVQDALRFRMEADYAHMKGLEAAMRDQKLATQDALRVRMELDFEGAMSMQRAIAHERAEASKAAADDAKKLAETQKRAFDDTFRSVKETASRAFLDIFKDGEFQFGRLAGVIKGIFRTLATEILSTMTATLITPLVQKLSGALNGILGKIPGLGGVFAGAGSAAGGGAIGTINPATGGLVGAAGISSTAIAATAGIAAAGLAAIAIVKSQAHHEASTFTRTLQDPFGGALSHLVDSFDAAKAAGKLTKDQAEEALESVETLWSTFTEEAKAFAKGGSDEAKVVKQAFETLTPLMDRIRTGMQATTDALRPIIPANSGPVTVNLQMDKRTFARLIIPDLYALTRNEGMVLIGAK